MKFDQADKYFSWYIRERDNWTCQRCGKRYERKSQGLHCSHYRGRKGERARFSLENCVALCYGCHQYFDETNRPAYEEFKRRQLGKEYDNFNNTIGLYKRKDRKLEAIIWREALKQLCKEKGVDYSIYK